MAEYLELNFRSHTWQQLLWLIIHMRKGNYFPLTPATLLTWTLIALSKSSCFLMSASTLSKESPLSSVFRKASRAAIQFSACSQSRWNSWGEKVPKHEQDRSRALLLPWNYKLINEKRNYFSYPNCSRVPVVPGTGPASFCAVPRPSPGLSVLGPEYPVSPWSLGWHSVHGLEVVVQTARMPGKCQLLHLFLCGVPASGRDVLLNNQSWNWPIFGTLIGKSQKKTPFVDVYNTLIFHIPGAFPIKLRLQSHPLQVHLRRPGPGSHWSKTWGPCEHT